MKIITTPRTRCDLCGTANVPVTDAPTKHRAWAYMCSTCLPLWEASPASTARLGSHLVPKEDS